MTQIFQDVLGFMPNFSVIIVAGIAFFLILVFHNLAEWFERVTRLPWMKEENQHIRDKLKKQE
ncbi:hypothetical protein M3212_19420 [Alkalihalobacillus oceani]|uniref:hypothetical protein n=1 Tax=Halalkalibacter oceani TaxID=1653776 RepID=UPI00203B936F|nr:hypothetical protein [Halalkalibacter oceani]MCM3762915.1 hypothetical protein [Halalkalibacter oceani]